MTTGTHKARLPFKSLCITLDYKLTHCRVDHRPSAGYFPPTNASPPRPRRVLPHFWEDSNAQQTALSYRTTRGLTEPCRPPRSNPFPAYCQTVLNQEPG